jgi:hypothetical protein
LFEDEKPKSKAKTGRGAWVKYYERDDMKAAEIFDKLRPFLFAVKMNEYIHSISAVKEQRYSEIELGSGDTSFVLNFPLQFRCRPEKNEVYTFAIVYGNNRHMYISGIFHRKPTFEEFIEATRAA